MSRSGQGKQTFAVIAALACTFSAPGAAQEVVEDIADLPPPEPKLAYRNHYETFKDDKDSLAGLSVDAPPDAEPPAGDIALQDHRVCYRDDAGQRTCWAPPIQQVVAGVMYYDIYPGARPWQAQTFVKSVTGDWQQQHWCGGAWLGEGWILTAAHCTRDGANAMHDVRVRLGAHDLSKGDGKSYRISRVVVHAGYVRGQKPNDIALLYVVPERPANSSAPTYTIAPIPIMQQSLYPHAGLKIGQSVNTTGWGRTSYKGPLRETLGETELKLVANSRCKAIYGERFSDRALCAYAPGTDSCEGDSGGPLTIGHNPRERRVVGIVSFGRGCAMTGIPGVYTRVDAYAEWIEQAKKQQRSFSRLPDPLIARAAR